MLNTIYKEGIFADKVAIITGGGTGIGLRTARELAQLGCTVVLGSRNVENLEAAAKQINDEGGKAFAVQCNIREDESVKACIATVIEKFGKIDFLVNNGGGQFPSPAEMISRKGWNAVIETNLTGTFFMSQEVFNRYMQDHGGAVVNVIANMFNGFPLMSHTGAARAGVDNLTKTLANEWGRYGVRVNAIAPGTIQSSGLEKYDPMYKEFIQGYAKHNQTQRLGTEAEIASAIIFLLSPAAAFITGATLAVDGGESIYHPVFPPQQNNANSKFE